jgi:hypothetical protein
VTRGPERECCRWLQSNGGRRAERDADDDEGRDDEAEVAKSGSELGIDIHEDKWMGDSLGGAEEARHLGLQKGASVVEIARIEQLQGYGAKSGGRRETQWK